MQYLTFTHFTCTFSLLPKLSFSYNHQFYPILGTQNHTNSDKRLTDGQKIIPHSYESILNVFLFRLGLTEDITK